MGWIKLVFFCLTFLSSIHASELSQDEINYFNIMDLNNDGYVSTDEINQSINIIFQLIDINNDKKISYNENDSLGGKDPYSASKASAEIIFSSFVQTYLKDKKNIKLASARAGNVIGGGDWSLNRIIPDMVRSIENNTNFLVRSKNSTRPWQHVLEPLSGYVVLGEKLKSDPLVNHESFNFAPFKFKDVTVKNIIEKIRYIWPEVRPIYQSERKNKSIESKLLQLNPNKAKRLLGWKSVLNLDETLTFTIDWYKNYYEGINPNSLIVNEIEKYYNS